MEYFVSEFMRKRRRLAARSAPAPQ